MNQDGVKSETIVSALKSEYTRQQSQTQMEASVSMAKSSKSHSDSTDQTQKRCYFYNADGHDLNSCYNTRRILNKVKAKQKSRAESSRKRPDKKPTKQAARSGRTSTATVVTPSKSHDEVEESDYSGSEYKVTARHASVLAASNQPPNKSKDANLDSGCSISMTPYLQSVNHSKTCNTPVCLADHSLVKSTHIGFARLPVHHCPSIETLVVPLLHEPLLSIASLCDINLTVVFDSI